jgi:circadian clock protein KaiB
MTIADQPKKMQQATEVLPKQPYVLCLYVAGATEHSLQAVRNIKYVCETFLKGCYQLEILDIYEQPELAEKNQIIAAPTLIKLFPVPVKRLIGDMSNMEAVVSALNIQG